MAENKELNPGTASHELDENKNPSSLNISPSINMVNNSFNFESDKKCPGPESPCSPGDTLLPVGLSTSQKNALVDSGFHCENLEKITPELVKSFCESVDNEFANGVCEEKQVSTTPITSIRTTSDSLNDSKDASLNTSTNITLMFERLTLNSAGNAQSAELSALPNDLAPTETSCILKMPTEVPLNDNLKLTNLSKVDINSNGSNTETPNISVSPDKNVQQLHMPDLNYVPNMENIVLPDETFNCSNPVNVSMNTNVESLDKSASDINNSIFTKTSLDDVFKCPLPVPESNNVPNDFNTSLDNSFPVEPDDNLEGEEFQDAVQFFKDPSSFQVLEDIKTSDISMPRDSLYMTFDPLYKRVIQPTDVESVDMKEKDNAYFGKVTVKEEICDANIAANNRLMSKHARESLGINLVSFDSPIKINSNTDSKEDIVEKDQSLMNKQSSLNFGSESLGIKLEDSPMKNSSDACSEKFGDLTKDSLKEGISKVENMQQFVNKHAQEPLGINLVSFDSPRKNNPDGNTENESETNKMSVKEEICSSNEVENDQHEVNKLATGVHADQDTLDSKLESDSPIKGSSEKNSEKVSDDKDNIFVEKEILDGNQQIVKKHLTRESLSGNLLSFDSPIKCNFENVKTSENEQKLHTDEEFQQALKIYELTMQEAYLKKQKELEEEALKQGSENVNKLSQITKLCKILLDTMSDLESIASEQNVKIGELSSRNKYLESENQELTTNLKTTTEDFQSVEHTFSDFHKRYVQCKDMLKTYKDNEDQLKTHIENLTQRLEEQEQINATLKVKMGEMVDKANAEVASAKKGGDAQLAVLNAQLKKSELKVSSLENDLSQARIENYKLSGICDELMAKVSEA